MPRAWIAGVRPLVAIFEEDRRFSSWLRATLESAGYRCLESENFTQVSATIIGGELSAVVLDLAGAEHDRLGAIRAIRRASETPILVVAERAGEQDKISALDAGADDYLTRPLGAGEFLARVRVALRHGRARRGPHGGQLAIRDLRIDLMNREVSLRGLRLALTPTDYKLLSLLARNVGRVVSHEQLLQEAWGPNAHDPHYLRVYMARLRRKLDPERVGVRYIVTEAGVGYRLVAEEKAQTLRSL